MGEKYAMTEEGKSNQVCTQEEHQRIHEYGHDLKIIGIYEETLHKVHVDCVFNGRGRTEKGRYYLISEETAQAVDDALNHWRKGAGKCSEKK